MKARLFAVALPLFVAGFSVHAAPVPATTKAAPAEQKTVAKIDLNQADVNTLSKSIKGIGPKRAEAIVKHREEHGKFKSIEDLAEVRGFGKQFVKNHLSQLDETFLIK